MTQIISDEDIHKIAIALEEDRKDRLMRILSLLERC